MAAAFKHKGQIKVFIDEILQKAYLELTSDGDEEFDEAAVFKLISDAGIKEGFDKPEVLNCLQKMQKSKQFPIKEAFAEGVLPEPAIPEQWIWDEKLTLDDNLKDVANDIVQKAGSPEVFSVKHEKVKVEKTQPAKSGLFGKTQEETISVIENREIREKVLVDPHYVSLFYVSENSSLAIIQLSKPGKPGRSLTGHPLAPAAPKNQSYFLGNGLIKHKNELKSLNSGFLRIGKNWVDLVPFEFHNWSVTFSADNSNAYLNLIPGNPLAPTIKAEAIYAFLNQSNFDITKIYQEQELQNLIDSSLKKNEALSSYPLTPDRNGYFEICISPDKVKATLNIYKSLGNGKALSLKDLGQGLRDAALKGFSFEASKKQITDFIESSKSELLDFPLAEGKPATRSKDKQLIYNVDFITSEEWEKIKSTLEANPKLLISVPFLASFTLDEVKKASSVKAGFQFALIQEPTDGKGEPGVDVYGQPIPPIPGNDPVLKLFKGIQRNGNNLEALVDGLLQIGEKEGATWFRISPHKDAVIEIDRSEDNMSAFLTLQQGQGTGHMLEMGNIQEALTQNQIVFGIEQDKIEGYFKSASSGIKVEKAIIARGKPTGGDLKKRLIFSVPGKSDDSGRFYAPIHDNEIAAEYWIPQGDNFDGMDILGNVVPGKDSEVSALKVTEDFKTDFLREGVQKITALRGGEVVFDGETLSLKHQIVLQSVSNRTGSVKFNGEVVIHGDVDPGLYIMAGSVKVKGQVKAALLSSDTHVLVVDGVKGEGKAVIRAKKSIVLGFAERSTLLSVGDMHIQKTILGCKVMCNGLILQKNSGGGIVGGLIKTKKGLDVFNLGSPNGTPTTISFGQDYLIEDQITNEAKETDKLRESIAQLDGLMKQFTQSNNKDKLDQARKKKVLFLKMLEKRNLKLINLRDKFEIYCPSEIIIRENIFPGVSIESHGRLYEVKSKKSSLKIVFNQNTGHIEEQPLE